MIHQYINNGYHIVLDVNSGSVHSVDALFYDVVKALSDVVADMEKPEKLTEDQRNAVVSALEGKYPKEDLEDALSDAQELIDAEELFTADIYKDYVVDFKKRQTVVKKIPNWAAAPNRNILGLDNKGPKSIMAPIPMNNNSGKASEASMPVSNSHCTIP